MYIHIVCLWLLQLFISRVDLYWYTVKQSNQDLHNKRCLNHYSGHLFRSFSVLHDLQNKAFLKVPMWPLLGGSTVVLTQKSK